MRLFVLSQVTVNACTHVHNYTLSHAFPSEQYKQEENFTNMLNIVTDAAAHSHSYKATEHVVLYLLRNYNINRKTISTRFQPELYQVWYRTLSRKFG